MPDHKFAFKIKEDDYKRLQGVKRDLEFNSDAVLFENALSLLEWYCNTIVREKNSLAIISPDGNVVKKIEIKFTKSD